MGVVTPELTYPQFVELQLRVQMESKHFVYGGYGPCSLEGQCRPRSINFRGAGTLNVRAFCRTLHLLRVPFPPLCRPDKATLSIPREYGVSKLGLTHEWELNSTELSLFVARVVQSDRSSCSTEVLLHALP